MESSDGGPLVAALRGLYERSRPAHPDLDVDATAFVEHAIACHDGLLHVDQVVALHGEDLLLACACARGDARALASFDATILAHIGRALGRAGGASRLEEVKQTLRAQLFVPDAGQPARICEYRGQASLATWVRVIAQRTAMTMARSTRRRRAREERTASLEPTAALDGTDLVHLRRRHAAALKASFEMATAELEPRARNLLRQHLIDKLSIDDLGALYHVNRVTAARWLSQARAEVADRTRRLLRERLRVSDAELDSLGRMVRSELDLSLTRVLAPGSDDREAGAKK